MNADASEAIRQHLIDPEVCIRCNTCESVCPTGAVTHDARNYVVDAAKCNFCLACIPPCPTGSIDNWRVMPRARAYSVEQQLTWDLLPAELSPDALSALGVAGGTDSSAANPSGASTSGSSPGATTAPRSAIQPHTNLFGPGASQACVEARVTGNMRVTAIGREYDTHHIVLDFDGVNFPVLEGQSIGIIPPGIDANGRPHHPRQYSIASPRNGERPGYNNLSLTVKRVLQDHQGNPVRGVASNYVCDLQVGDVVKVIGPFGSTFLMPNHVGSSIVMICTGTGSAPMRAMTEWRRREASAGRGLGGKLLLFFGARTKEDLPYFGPLQNLPKEFIDINFAFSRTPGQPKRYVQDIMRERAQDLARLLRDPDAYFYVCGLKAMETGVVAALEAIARDAGLDWAEVAASLRDDARLHMETY